MATAKYTVEKAGYYYGRYYSKNTVLEMDSKQADMYVLSGQFTEAAEDAVAQKLVTMPMAPTTGIVRRIT